MYLFVIIMLIISNFAFAESIQLKAELSHPILNANHSQKTYLKIALIGNENQDFTRPEINLAIVLDKSGSMQGSKIQAAKEAANVILDYIGRNDTLSLITYDDYVQVLVPSRKIGSKVKIRSIISDITAGGSTALYDGVVRGSKELRKYLNDKKVNRIILLSDGLANVGPDSPEALGRLGKDLSYEGISVSTIGLGLGFNEDLMTQLARNSDGNHAFVESPKDLADIFTKEFGTTTAVVAKNIQVKIELAEGINLANVFDEKVSIQGKTLTIDYQQVYAEQEKFLMLEVEVPAMPEESNRKIANITVQYDDLQKEITSKIQDAIYASFSQDVDQIAAAAVKDILAKAASLIALDRNKKALELRDAGKIDAARKLLTENVIYLKEKAEEYGAEMLLEESEENAVNADNLEGEDWERERKSMRYKQYQKDTQQMY